MQHDDARGGAWARCVHALARARARKSRKP
nr:MAG TPA: hypothetical protein [Caudoviricetes sp.]